MKPLPTTTDVVIVGAGPVGLVLACVLAKIRIPFLIVDELEEGLNTSRAAVVHARTLEVLEELEVTDRLRAEGLVVQVFTISDRDRVLAKVHFEGLPTRYPFTLMVPQNVTEAILLARLRELGEDVYRPYKVTDLSQGSDRATVTVSSQSGESQKITAKYVIGTDGMHSIVREHAGIGFTGATYEESFVLADVRMKWSLRADEVMLFFSPEGLVVVAPLPGGRHRVVATLDDAPEHPGMADVQRLLDTRGPQIEQARVEEIVWSSRFRVHHRVADRYRNGRVLLAGDSAHVHSPAGGQGMNTGIQDAITLGHVLAKVLSGQAEESWLDTYEHSRRPVGLHVVALTDRMTRVATLRYHWARSLRNTILRVVGRIPAVRRRLAVELAELRYR
jgi:2-polyprenyl-6-methoxyphenol hydroxylase-like FAD-dependent oxidoreductase